MAEYIIKDKVEWYKCKADITIGDKDFGNTGIVVIPVADISELPTIDIVHCKDCKYCKIEDWDKNNCRVCTRDRYIRSDSFFCADGERKE